MTDAAVRAVKEAVPGRLRELWAAAPREPTRPGNRRHPLVAAVMAVPVGLLLAVACGGWHSVVVQASSVAGIMGR